MTVPAKSFLAALACVLSLACGSTDDFQAGEAAAGDSDPSLYFSRRTGPARTAVLSFSPADGGTAFFDAFVTDEVIRRLAAAKNLTLIERSRIDLVLQEHALGQAGLVSSKEASRLGTLLAADHLVTGTYTYKKETIFVRGRVLDAASGSIESTFAFPIPYRGTTVKAPPAETITTDKGCEAVQRPVLLALRDLSTPSAVENAVDRAIAVPWKKPCGGIHRKVTSEFSIAKLYPRRYHVFLVKTLEAMESPQDEYYTVQDIFSYFARDGVITEFEWAAAREILKRAWHPFHLKYFFNPDRYSEVVIKRRISELLDLARKNEIGRPYALSEYRVADNLITTPFTNSTDRGIAISLFILGSIRDPAAAPPKHAKSFFNVMTACYKETFSPDLRRESLDMLIAFMKARSPDDDYAYELWSFLSTVDEKSREKRKPYMPGLPFDTADLRKINDELRPYVCRRWKLAIGNYHEKEVGDYIRRYGVRCTAE